MITTSANPELASLPLTAALRLVAFTTMRQFTKEDWNAYAGAESADPLIGTAANGWTVVLDGATLYVDDNEGGYTMWEMADAADLRTVTKERDDACRRADALYKSRSEEER